MLLDGPSCLPVMEPINLYSFYPYPISPRSHVHSTLFPTSDPSSSSSSQQHSTSKGTKEVEKQTARDQVQKSMRRAERRALMGRRPTGVGLSRDDDEVMNEEDMLDHEQHDINMFGHRFLLPFGRRLTQMEMDAAPSPSPSEHDHERRQEDHTMGSPMMEPHIQGEQDDEDEEDGGQVDLDASIEDLDNSEMVDEGEEEGSMEEE
ncbi:hypothetical protein I203_100139 [Kwoniella mangroviensis CBS 8507]|uniref:uncharacterized protein n=1 Tax=Kwoniella mangroviensis CBS 8507 TaxID=1296122 RepID=UPI00080D16BB|nr:uncharacterized protein I203_07900 [Kwoniella mangroviensis CBS 8507]OCF62921.1 hypothetical protein I203_07900 [Kwoniella mangroviensis CBS 8507]